MRKYKLYVIRLSLDKSNSDLFANSAPCRDCEAQLKKYGIKTITYSYKQNKMITKKVKDLCTQHQSQVKKYLIEEGVLTNGTYVRI